MRVQCQATKSIVAQIPRPTQLSHALWGRRLRSRYLVAPGTSIFRLLHDDFASRASGLIGIGRLILGYSGALYRCFVSRGEPGPSGLNEEKWDLAKVRIQREKM
jgi:hypothetical protein